MTEVDEQYDPEDATNRVRDVVAVRQAL